MAPLGRFVAAAVPILATVTAAARLRFGVSRVLRHPVYLSFLGLVWLVPVVALDRAVLMAVWSVCIVLGSVLKDRRLVHFLGAAYRDYQARVPGYPGMPFGPLARLK